MTILKAVTKFVKQKIDDAFHKAHGQNSFGEMVSIKQGFNEHNPDRVVQTFRRDLSAARAKQDKALAYPGDKNWPNRPAYPNLAQRQDDKKAEHNAHEAVRFAVEWSAGAVVDNEGFLGDAMAQAMRHLKWHMDHTKKTGRFCSNFAQGEEHVYVALMDLHDAETNGLDRAHGRIRMGLTRSEYLKLKDDYADVDAQANSDWHSVVEDRRTKLRAAVTAYISIKPAAQLPEAIA